MDERTDALLAAAREAMVNASIHSGAAKVDVFCESGSDCTEVFVRDTGSGFNTDDVPADRRGITESINGRMSRVGGSASVRTGSGTGTEVHLVLAHEEPTR